MTLSIGLPGASELAIILVIGVLVGGIALTTFFIARARRRSGDQNRRE